jgi:hypothetical protein
MWYDRRASELGKTFIEQVESRIAEVVADPQRFAKLPAGCRYVRIPRFPKVVLFDATGEEVLFPGVMFTARSEEKWKERQTEG